MASACRFAPAAAAASARAEEASKEEEEDEENDDADNDGDGNRNLEVLRVHCLEALLPRSSLTCGIVAVSAVSARRAVHERGLEHYTLVAVQSQIQSYIEHEARTHPLEGSLQDTTQLSSFFCPHASVKFIELPD